MRIFFLFILIIGSSLVKPGDAQVFTGSRAASVIPNARKVWLDEESGALKFVRFQTPQPVNRDNPVLFVERLLKIKTSGSFRLQSVERDKIGMTHYRFDQYANNIRVEDRRVYVHSSDRGVHSLNGNIQHVMFNAPVSLVSEILAFHTAKRAVPSSRYYWEALGEPRPVGKKVYFIENGRGKLAYKFDIYSLEPYSGFAIYVDAVSGNVLLKESRVMDATVTGTAHTKYYGVKSILTDSITNSSGTQYFLRDSLNNIYTYDLNTQTSQQFASDFVDSDNIWNTTASQDDAALDAHWGAKQTYDYYLLEHGRNSFDNAGSPIKSYVHFGNNVVNASWGFNSTMSFGDGDGVDYTALTSLDIVGHEFTHGVVLSSAGLNYFSEPGGLNESFADIFGKAVEFYANPSGANWLLGDMIHATGNGFRNLANPKSMNQPDTYLGDFWLGGVHTQSGVQNYWFYLLSAGGSGTNDNGDAYNVSGIGMADAAAIAYRNLTVYLLPTSIYSDARFYAIESAIDLFGPCSPQDISTTDAWYAVGVGDPFNNVSAKFTFSPSYVTCSTPATFTFINQSLEDTAWLWDFGDGTTSALENPVHTYNATGNYTVQLIVYGPSACTPSVDTVAHTIQILSVPKPKDPACTPNILETLPPFGFMGVVSVDIGSIHNVSAGNMDGYQDFSCAFRDTIQVGDWVPFTIVTDTTLPLGEYLYIFLDTDSNGFLSSSELLWSDQGNIHSGYFQIPANTVLNTHIRLRLISSFQPISLNFCSNIQKGEVEDYALYITPVAAPPVADFQANMTNVLIGTTVDFNDLSSGLPNTRSWSFPGGTPTSSSGATPAITYDSLGTFDAKLSVSNALGSDSLTKTNYIHVFNGAKMCDATINMVDTGVVYDSGGEAGDYGNNENCTFVIAPECADTIILEFSSFSTQKNHDYLIVTDGTDINGTLLLVASGDSLPATLYATSGAMFLRFFSDGFTTFPGFEASWTTVLDSVPVVNAAMGISNDHPPFLGEVTFTDQSTGNPAHRKWILGDGTILFGDSISHTYTDTGEYYVSLIVSNCQYSDTAFDTVIVQNLPSLSVIAPVTDTIYTCLDSITVPVWLENNGPGDLTFQNFYAKLTSIQKSIVNPFTTSGAVTQSVFNMHRGVKNDLNFTVRLVGDFDAPSEYAVVYLDGMLVDTINPTGFTSQTTYSFDAKSIESLLADGQLTVSINNSPAVNPMGQSGSKHKVTLEYAHEYFVYSPAQADTLHAGDSLQILLTVYDTSGLAPGWHYDTLKVYSNDTLNHPLAIPIAIWNDGKPELDLSPSCLNFDTIASGTAKSLPVVLYNLNCEQLQINSITNIDTTFSLSTSSISIDSIGQDTLWITAGSSSSSGWVFDTVQIQSNDKDTTVCLSVFISEYPVSNFAITSTDICMGSYHFTDQSGNNPSAWQWDFGDGGSSTLQNPSHTYLSSGTYTVTLISTNAFGSDTALQTVNIQFIGVSYTYSGTLIPNQPIQFTGSGNNVTSWQWDFGDGNNSNQQNPTHVYASNGIYFVVLTASDSNNCLAEFSDTLLIKATGINELGAVLHYKLYPNPGSKDFFMEYTGPPGELELSLSDASGREVLRKTAWVQAKSVLKIHRTIAPGVYFLTLEIHGQKDVLKLVVK